jgi:hypothetical protein
MKKVRFIEGYSCNLKGKGTSSKLKFQESGADYSNRINVESRANVPTHKDHKPDALRDKFPYNETRIYLGGSEGWVIVPRFLSVTRVKQMYPTATSCYHVRSYFEDTEGTVFVGGRVYECADIACSEEYKLFGEKVVHETVLPDGRVAYVQGGKTLKVVDLELGKRLGELVAEYI